MAAGQGIYPPNDILGGPNKLDPITVKSVWDYVHAWIKYYYYEYDLGAQYSLGFQGPYISGHRAATPLNPTGPSQAELVFRPQYYGAGGPMPSTGPLQEQRWATSQAAHPGLPARLVSPDPNLNTPASPLYDRARVLLYPGQGMFNEVGADEIWDAVLDIVSKQTAISWTILKYRVYGDGGNRGYFNPTNFNATKNFSDFYNNVHRVRWTKENMTPNLYNLTPYGNPTQTDPNQTFNAPAWVLQWQVDIIYGSKSFATRLDVNQGNAPIPPTEMEILFVPETFPQTIPGSTNPRNNPSAESPQLRDGRITQPRVRRYISRNSYPNLERDKIILQTDLIQMVSAAVGTMFIGDFYSTTYFERLVCHASCHGSCHGSRGRR